MPNDLSDMNSTLLRPLSSWLGGLENERLRNAVYATKEVIRAHPAPILIYQMGKVGSTTVYRSLRSAGLYPLHVHRIIDRMPEGGAGWHARPDYVPDIDVYVGRILAPYLRWSRSRVRVITLVRDPVARYLSKVFHRPEMYDDLVASERDETVRRLRDHLGKPETLDDGMFRWFDEEIRARLGVDVMTAPFDRQAGYSVLHGERADILVLKLEKLSELLPTAVSEFVGRPLREERANVGERKESADAYRAVRRSFSLPEPVLDRIYDHEWMRHFYTEGERERFRSRWSIDSEVAA